jgi:hypothetical protein
VGPVLVAVGTLGAALPAITAGFQVLGVSSLAALGPILPVAAAVGAAAYLIYENWSELTAYFTSGEGATLFSDLASSAGAAADSIGEAFSTMRASSTGNLGEMVSAATIFRSAFREASVGVRAALDVLGGTISGITNLLTGDFSQAASGASQAFYGLIDPIANLLGFTVRVQEANPILVLSQHATEFNAVFPQLRANLDALNNVRLGTLAEQAGAAAKQIGLLAALEARLKEAKEAKPNLTTEAEIAASNQLIASLEEQIKRLNALGIASKEMQKALAEVQKSLRTVANESLALGDQYDYLKNRQSATESGIKKLIGAGFSPASAAVQRLVADLRNLNTTLGDNSLLNGRSVKGSEKLFETPDFKVKTPEALQLPAVLPMDLTGLDLSAEGLSAGYDKLIATQNQKFPIFTQAMADFNTRTQELTDAFPAAGFSAIAQGIGDAIGGGSDVLAAAGAGLIKALAEFASQQGALLVALGVSNLTVPGLQPLGAAQIAAGGALIIAAGVAGAFASSIGSSSSASSAPTAGAPRATNYGQNSSQQPVQVVATLQLRGPDLTAVLRGDAYRVKLTG